jgi:hypothetical protein
MNDERVVALSARRAARLADLFARDRALPAALDDAGGRLREANEQLAAGPFGRGAADDLARP